MFSIRRIKILEAVCGLWSSHVVLCDSAHLYQASRKLIGVLKFLTLLRNKTRFREISLTTTQVNAAGLTLPAFSVVTANGSFHVAIAIDPIEAQGEKLRFILHTVKDGAVIASKPVIWSTSAGPDLLHASSLLKVINQIDQDLAEGKARQHETKRLEARIRVLSGELGLTFSPVHPALGNGFCFYLNGNLIAEAHLIKRGDAFITNVFFYSSESDGLMHGLKSQLAQVAA